MENALFKRSVGPGSIQNRRSSAAFAGAKFWVELHLPDVSRSLRCYRHEQFYLFIYTFRFLTVRWVWRVGCTLYIMLFSSLGSFERGLDIFRGYFF